MIQQYYKLRKVINIIKSIFKCIAINYDIIIKILKNHYKGKRRMMPVSLFVCSSDFPSVFLSYCPSVCPSACMSVCSSDFPSICPSFCPFVCSSVCPPVYLPICLLSFRLHVRLSVQTKILLNTGQIYYKGKEQKCNSSLPNFKIEFVWLLNQNDNL